MVDDRMSARWIAIGGGAVLLSICGATCLLVTVLGSSLGGRAFTVPGLPLPSGNNNAVVEGGGSPGGPSAPANTTSTTGTTGGTGPTSTTGGSGTTTGNTVPLSGNVTVYLPRFSGYSTADASTIEGALQFLNSTGAFGAQSAGADTDFSAQSLSAIGTSILVARMDEFLACSQRSGAVDARVYVRTDVSALIGGEVPALGAVALVNTARLRESLVACAVRPNDPNSFSAQAANQPCGDVGSFTTANGEQITYVYAGTSSDFCVATEAHFAAYSS